MQNMRKWILGALLLVMFGILSGCGKKEAVTENENLPGEGFWDFIERKCDSLKPGVLPEKKNYLNFSGDKNGEWGIIELSEKKEREKLREILSDVRVIEIEDPGDDSPHHSGFGITMGNDPDDPEGWMRVELNVYEYNKKNKNDEGYRGYCTINYWGEDSGGCGSYCYFIQPQLPEGEPDFVKEMRSWYSEIYDEVWSAFPEEGMALLDALPKKWNTVTIGGGITDKEYELKKEDIEKVKEILEPVHIESQIPYSNFTGRITLTINGDRYTCWDGVVGSENPYNTKWDVTWQLYGDYGDTGYLERLEELYRTYDTGQ